jgi:carboxylate-amine ligase
VEIASADEGVAVLDRIRPWLPVLLALSANSPFWQGADTGYASYRSLVVSRWPSAGMPSYFGSAAEYAQLVQAMLDSGVLLDEGMVYFDVRLSRSYPTIEVRIADVCLRVDDTLLVAVLTRALVETLAVEWQREATFVPARAEVLRLAKWRAARSALDGELMDPLTGKPAPARAAVDALLDYVTPVLTDLGELESVQAMLADLWKRGPGARTQRSVMSRTDDPVAVVHEVVRQTLLT